MDKLFNITKSKESDYIKKIRATASQISHVEVDKYKGVIREYLEFVGEEIQNYLKSLSKNYYVVMIYYSLIIENIEDKRITARTNEEDYILKLKDWYDNKCKTNEAFSLVPESLGAHKINTKPRKYLIKLFEEKNVVPSNTVNDIDEIPIYCYENSSLWDTLSKEIENKQFNNVLEKLMCMADKELFNNKNCLDKILDKGFKIIKGTRVTKNHLLPFIMLWYPIYKKGYYYQYYIPSPMYSNTPIGGLVIGTTKLLEKEEIDNLEDIALKVSVDINFIEHSEKIEKLSIEKGASIITASVAHNITNRLKGFSTSLELIVDQYPGIYIRGYNVENKINWLNFANPHSKFKLEKINVNLLDLILRAFNSAWEILLLIGGIVNNVNLTKKFKKKETIVYPILKVINDSKDKNYFVSIRYYYKKHKDKPAKYITWKHNNILHFNDKVYKSYQPLYICEFRANNFTLIDNNKKSIELSSLFNNKIKIPEDSIPGLEGCFEEIFFNAFKYSKIIKPLCVSCSLNYSSIEITNSIPNDYKQNESGGGLFGNKAAFEKLGWKYTAKHEDLKFISRIIIR